MATKPENNQTPEEQLLRLIEDQRPAGPAEAGVPASTMDDITLPEIKSSGGGFKSISRRIAVALGRSAGGNIIRVVNRLLVGIMVLLAAYMVWGFANASGLVIDKGPETGDGKIPPVPEQVQVDEYLSVINQRDIFNPPKVVVPVKTAAGDTRAQTDTPSVSPPPPAKKALEKARDNFKLVGITWEPAPPLAIIEDSAIQITRYLQEGETIETKVQIGEVPEIIKITAKQITKNKVILQYEQEETELAMKGGY